MRYSLEPYYRRYVQGQGFMSFARNIGNKYGKKIFDKSLDVGKSMKKIYGKKILDNRLSAGKDFAKIAGKKVLIPREYLYNLFPYSETTECKSKR